MGLFSPITKRIPFSRKLVYSKKELEAMTVNDIAHPEDKEISPKFIETSKSGGVENTIFEKRYIHKKGHVVWGQVSS